MAVVKVLGLNWNTVGDKLFLIFPVDTPVLCTTSTQQEVSVKGHSKDL